MADALAALFGGPLTAAPSDIAATAARYEARRRWSSNQHDRGRPAGT